MYYFDPDFGYVHVKSSTLGNSVRYGLGPVVPHDPSTLAEQRYMRFEKWVEIQPHHVPDEWLIAFGKLEKKPEPKPPQPEPETETVVLDIDFDLRSIAHTEWTWFSVIVLVAYICWMIHDL